MKSIHKYPTHCQLWGGFFSGAQRDEEIGVEDEEEKTEG